MVGTGTSATFLYLEIEASEHMYKCDKTYLYDAASFHSYQEHQVWYQDK